MPFQPGQSGNPLGRPPGSKTSVVLSVSIQRKVIKALTTRALEQDDSVALETLALLLITQNQGQFTQASQEVAKERKK